MNLIKLSGAIAAMALTTLSSCGFAATVYPMSVKMTNGSTSQIKVMSDGKNIEYINTSVKKIINPGTASEKEIDIPEGGSEFVATPRKFILPVGGTRIVRLVNVQPPEKETAYHVYFTPVSAPDNDAKHGEAATGKIGVSITWGALVFVPPANPKIAFTFDSQNMTLKNTGTLHVKIKRIGYCSNDKDCQWTSIDKSVYPEQEYKFVALKNNVVKSTSLIKVEYTNWLDGTLGSETFPR